MSTYQSSTCHSHRLPRALLESADDASLGVAHDRRVCRVEDDATGGEASHASEIAHDALRTEVLVRRDAEDRLVLQAVCERHARVAVDLHGGAAVLEQETEHAIATLHRRRCE